MHPEASRSDRKVFGGDSAEGHVGSGKMRNGNSEGRIRDQLAYLKYSLFLRMYSRHFEGTVNSSKMALTGHAASQ